MIPKRLEFNKHVSVSFPSQQLVTSWHEVCEDSGNKLVPLLLDEHRANLVRFQELFWDDMIRFLTNSYETIRLFGDKLQAVIERTSSNCDERRKRKLSNLIGDEVDINVIENGFLGDFNGFYNILVASGSNFNDISVSILYYFRSGKYLIPFLFPFKFYC